ASVVYDFDFFADPRMIENSHARVLEIVRDARPVFCTPRNGGHWIIASHSAVFKTSRDPESCTVEMVRFEDFQAMQAALPPRGAQTAHPAAEQHRSAAARDLPRAAAGS